MIGVIDPDRLAAILKEVAEVEVARYKQALQDALDEGWLIWSIQSPMKRLHGYLNATLHPDTDLLMNKDYWELWKAGVLPPLQALTQWQQVAASGMPPQSYQQFFWALLTILPDFCFKHFQDDFIKLMNLPASKLPPELQLV